MSSRDAGSLVAGGLKERAALMDADHRHEFRLCMV